MRPSEFVAAVVDYRTRVLAVGALVEAAAQAGGASTAQLEAARSASSGLEADLRSTLRELDRIDETDWLLVEDGERTLALWRWRRDLRHNLLALWRLVHQLALVARDLVGGTRQKVVVVRDGETWQSIAARELGGWQEWPRLRAANPTIPPGLLVSGASLVVPEKR